MAPIRSRRNSTKSTATSSQQKILSKLLDFLDSSIWHLPIETFIEQQSIVFDRQQDDSDLYMRVHHEFGNLVDTLLECFCEDTGIRPEELVGALEKIEKERMSAKAKAAYEPLAAAQNYAVFVPMMMRKNVELQLQALQMIEFMCGIIPTVLKIEESDSLRGRVVHNLSGEDAEKYVLLTVLRQSKDEFDSSQQSEKQEIEAMLRAEDFQKDRARLMAEAEQNEKDVEAALALPPDRPLSRAPSAKGDRKVSVERKPSMGVAAVVDAATAATAAATVAIAAEKRPPTAEKKISSVERKTSVSVAAATAGTAAVVVAASEKRPPTAEKKLPSTASGERKTSTTTSRPGTAKTKKPLARKSSSIKSAAEPSIDSIDDGIEGKKGRTAADIRALLQAGDQLDPEMLAARAAYLREQRSKLTQMKQAEREKQLAANASATQDRPKTAKAARGMMRGARGEGGGEEIIAARKALVEKLKENV